jgi:hypothetical protein
MIPDHLPIQKPWYSPSEEYQNAQNSHSTQKKAIATANSVYSNTSTTKISLIPNPKTV